MSEPRWNPNCTTCQGTGVVWSHINDCDEDCPCEHEKWPVPGQRPLDLPEPLEIVDTTWKLVGFHCECLKGHVSVGKEKIHKCRRIAAGSWDQGGWGQPLCNQPTTIRGVYLQGTEESE